MTADFGYVVVEGPIGVGKTTVCNLLASQWKAVTILEEVEENPFLSRFYRNRKAWAFQTQLFFMLSRYGQQKKLAQLDLFSKKFVADYMFAKDRIFASINLQDDEFVLYEKLCSLLAADIPQPDLVIYLQGSCDSLLKRISSRGRSFESDISRSYLEKLTDAYNDYFFRARKHPTLVVNTDHADFRHKGEDFNRLVEAIGNHTGGVESFVPRLGGRR
ncbi:MAG: deoxynucleoside kinase [Candidatus Aegiribacteria sp.]|nr:deoxynucleoside kinase [Candidatus Aegiribacteria sp.]